MRRSFTPPGASIGQGRRSRREIIAREKAEAAVVARGFIMHEIQPAPSGPGVIAIAVNGTHIIVHLGPDPASALFGLAALASRPEGRG